MSYFILICACIAFLLLYGLYRNIRGAKGTWSTQLVSPPPTRDASSRDSEGEQRTRAFLERYFGRSFQKIRPDFLANEITGQRLELDCYNPELRLAVEYNGRQHYEFVPFFHSSKEAFYNQKYRDKLKRMYCSERGIRLIEIPYTELPRLEYYLSRQLEILGFTTIRK